ncbi:G-protein alpha subunit [Guyanagaster necrorhizus]|uniref:G-protein alpha subunit n=1 Tax=Guyanagaster necrorhizus TaxID=856835 RepID=A0A9P7VR57_9AGAR|nr:G-protein alpha subunit [Guyanagaster necrorhizus MCA 3950]KAG7444476.1 G-protein alpha subunit [Guyanagaster necrorhizus MCA 3950]
MAPPTPAEWDDVPILKPESAFFDVQAQTISNGIDEELKKESQRRRDASRKEVKVMLLGQAESGKSTLQKQFQLYYASTSIEHERPSWKPIVHFNTVKAVRLILEELDYDLSRPIIDSPDDMPLPDPQRAQEEINQLRSQLLPLVAMEDALASELSGGISVGGGRAGVFVRAGWQALVTTGRNWPLNDMRTPSKTQVAANMAAKILHNLRNEINTLWHHPAVERLLALRHLKLDEAGSFFLDNLMRITEPDYMPIMDDILNVRVQTLGVIEHSFPINIGGTVYDWKLYDVGGALIMRWKRHAWVPYFEDATAIIFLAPISAFDQYLEEDPRTNRIDDSLKLFTAVCSNKLLRNTHLVLLLNKTDLLRKKLETGSQVQKYIVSYGNRPNRYEDVSEYFRAHFVQVHRRKDIADRHLYCHFTSMLDIAATQRIIVNVGEAIIRQHISRIGLM